MTDKIKIGICGYGNLGRGVASEVAKNPDMQLVGVFTRRPAAQLHLPSGLLVVHTDDAEAWRDKVDVMILCGGSANDLPGQGPDFARLFNTVDSFDTHAKIPAYFRDMDNSAKLGDNVSVVSIGWDPGLFSLMRLYMGAVLPLGKTYTFWGSGVSQGHSDAVRGIEGVADAVQYTIPVASAMEMVRNGENPEFTTREKHTRLCYVAAEDGADKELIERKIKQMPNYFDAYDTSVRFVSQKELKDNHSRLPHAGNVIHNAATGAENSQIMEFSLKLDSNPEFTASVLLAYARAAKRLHQNGVRGAVTIFDIPPAFLSVLDAEELLQNLL